MNDAFYVEKHSEHYIFALYTSEPILMLTAPTICWGYKYQLLAAHIKGSLIEGVVKNLRIFFLTF